MAKNTNFVAVIIKQPTSLHKASATVSLKTHTLADAIKEVRRRRLNMTNGVHIQYANGLPGAYVSSIAEAAGSRKRST